MKPLYNALIAACFFSISASADPVTRPNIIFMFSDDHTWQSIGSYGGPLAKLNPTPNLDRLAKEGMRFDRFYVGNSICAPARATLLTGKHSHKNGKLNNRDPFNHDQQQFQKILQKNGYQTAMVGKIHLSGAMQGFDYWDVLPGQGHYYQPQFISPKGSEFVEGYVADIITDKSIDWLNNKRDKDKPFMLMVHHKGTHRSWMPAERHLNTFDDHELPVPDTLFDDYATRAAASREQDMSIEKTMTMRSDLKVRTEKDQAEFQAFWEQRKPTDQPHHNNYFRFTEKQRATWDAAYDPKNKAFLDAKLKGTELINWKYQRYLKNYLRTALSIDDSMGRVLDWLKENNMEENTIVIYSSDQGFYLGEHGWFDKRFMYEESYRTPLLVRWPQKIKAGSINSDLCQNIDFAPTFLDLAGVQAPDDMQGLSLNPLLKGNTPDDWRNSLYYHYYEYPGTHSVHRHEGVSTKTHKLIRYYGRDVPNGEEWELFDYQNDPQELNNLYQNPENKELITTLKKELQHLKTHYEVPAQ